MSKRGPGRIFSKTTPTAADLVALARRKVDPSLCKNDFFDYSKVVVRKPWGYEYLIFQNDAAAVWILHIKSGFQTSLHCHPTKKTAIAVLSGSAVCSTLEGEVTRGPGTIALLGKGVFHRTRSTSSAGTYVMEVETPVNKRDLVRLVDDYGRRGLGYESTEHMSLKLQNYNYASYIDPKAYYNVKKHFGRCSIEFCRFPSDETFRRFARGRDWDAVCVLGGGIDRTGKGSLAETGDVCDRTSLGRPETVTLRDELQAIVIRRSDASVRLADYVVAHLKRSGVRDFFFVPGTSNAHLVDALGRDTDCRSLPLQTEAAAAQAAEAYAKLTGSNGVVIVPSGSASAAALVGVSNAWIDSAPVLVLSGQTRPTDLGAPGRTPQRQLVSKELDIASVARPITKGTSVISAPSRIAAELDRALWLSRAGRPGPVWLDLPIDLQGMSIDEGSLAAWQPPKPSGAQGRLRTQVRRVMHLLERSQRPVLLAGHGIRLSGANDLLPVLARQLGIPVLTSRRGIDLLPDNFPLLFGRPGTYGQRRANFVIQNCDLLLAIGTRLSLPLIGRNYRSFARAATKVVVDADAHELGKATVQCDVAVVSDAGAFLRELGRQLGTRSVARPAWLARCRQWRRRFDPLRESRPVTRRGVDPYRFVAALSEALDPNAILVVDGGPTLDFVMQTFRVKAGQRVISSPGLEHEGFALPGAIGACMGSAGRQIVCLCSKKGLQLNLPELQTLANFGLPLKTFVFNSQGDPRLRQVQAAYFGSRYVGSVSHGVVGSLDVGRLAKAYKMLSETVRSDSEVATGLAGILRSPGPVLCEVLLPEALEIIPRLTFTVRPDGHWVSKPLEDMFPFLDRRKLQRNMIVAPLEED